MIYQVQEEIYGKVGVGQSQGITVKSRNIQLSKWLEKEVSTIGLLLTIVLGRDPKSPKA